MKRVQFSNILVTISVFATILITPYLLNTLICAVHQICGYQIPLYFNMDTWYDIMSIAVPTALTYIVIRQSEQQQNDNLEIQDRLERINEKTLNLEQKARLGYFVPYVKLKDAGVTEFDRSNYTHNLEKYITLANIGTDDVFVLRAQGAINGRTYPIPLEIGLFVSKTPPFKEVNIDCQLSNEERKLPHIDVEISLILRNMAGYKYMQTLYIGFKNQDGKGAVESFNMSIQEVPNHAD